MKQLSHWFETQRKAQDRLTTIQQALLGNGLSHYIKYRLRFFSMNTLIVTAVHLIEFYILTLVFSFTHIVSILVLRSISMAIHGFWWGSLELLRSEVRTAQRSGDRGTTAHIISNWLTASFALCSAALIVIAATIIHLFTNSKTSNDSFFIIYIAVIGIGIAAQFITQTLHAGAYGVRRVYRPFWSLPISHLTSLAVLVTLWPLIHRYSLPCALLVGSVMSLALTTIYTLKTYHILGIKLLLSANIQQSFRIFKLVRSPEMWLAGLSGILMSAEGVLVIIMLIGAKSNSLHYEPFIIFYLIAPLISAGFDWPRLFYFDLKRLNRPCFRAMIAKLNRYALRVSLMLAFFLWLISLAICALYLHTPNFIPPLLLIFLLARSYLSYQQMIRFSSNNYLDVIISACFIITAALLSRYLNLSISQMLICIAIISSFGIAFLLNPRFDIHSTQDEDPVQNLYQWLINWKNNQSAINLITLSNSKHTSTTHRVMLQLNKILNNQGKACQLNDNTLLLYQNASPPTITASWVTQQLAGLATAYKKQPGELIDCLKQFIPQTQHQSAEKLITQFKREVPQGVVINFDATDSNPEHISKRMAADIYMGMIQSLNAPLQIKYDAAAITLVIYNDCIKALLVIPKNTLPISQIKRWVRQTYLSNINSALNTAI